MVKFQIWVLTYNKNFQMEIMWILENPGKNLIFCSKMQKFGF